MVSKARVTTKKKEGIYGWGNMLVKTWRWTSVEQGNISCITQLFMPYPLEEAAFRVPFLLCIEAETAWNFM